MALLLAALLWPASALALISGTAPTLYRSFRVFGNSVSVGNTLMRNVASEPLVNAVLLRSSQARISGLPTNAAVEGAFLFWSGSVDPAVGVDNTASLTLPSGARRTITADRCLTASAPFGGGVNVQFFYCRADVTSFVASASPLNGLYTVGDVTAMPGTLAPGGGCVDATCQAMYAGWSLVLVHESPTETTLRDVVIQDGFLLLDETPTSAAITSFTVSGFEVANPPEATLRIFGLEGDALLGVPPQDSDPVLRCTTCFDYMAVNGVRLSNPFNPAGNLFNSSVPEGSAIGVDIDTFDISAQVRAGDRTLRIEVGSGDGDPRTGHENGAGGGELFLLGYNVLTINRLAPNFRTARTFLSADPSEAAPGETIFYTLQVTNDGSLDATGVRALLNLPAGAEYVPGSTRVDDVAVPDGPGGVAPWIAGINLGRIPATGANSRRITFRLRVAPGTPGGTLLINRATITAAELPEPTITNDAVVRVIAPRLQVPRKTFSDLNGGSIEPGDLVTYTITLPKDPDTAVAGLTFEDPISPFVQLRSVSAGGFVDQSQLSGGPAGTGLVRITDIAAPRGVDRIAFTYTVQVRPVAELLALGVAPADLDGLAVSNQGVFTAAFLPAPLRTDNPATAATPDATVFRLAVSVNLRNAQTFKRVEDDNGGLLEPGDTITYTLSLRNDGSSDATVDVVDDLPANLTGAQLLAPVAGVTLRPAPAGASGTGRLEAFGLRIPARTTVVVRLRATVAADASGGASVQNIARLTVQGFPEQNQDLATEDLRVSAGPAFALATKIAEGGVGGFAPGDEVLWTLTFRNTGNRPATEVVVTDPVSPNLTAIVPEDGGSWDAAARIVRWNVPSIAVGQTVTLRFRARILASVPDGTTIANQGRLVVPGVAAPVLTDDPATPAAGDPTVIRVQALPALVFTKTVQALDPAGFEPGRPVRYLLRIRNEGRAPATAVVVEDALPSELRDAVAGQGGIVSGGVVRWSAPGAPALASIAPGQVVELSLDAIVADGVENGTLVRNQALARFQPEGGEVRSDDPARAGPADPTEFVVRAAPRLVAQKTVVDDNGGAVQPGDLLRWTIVLRNEGTGPARDVVVTDPVDAALVDITPLDGGLFNAATRTLLWTPPVAVGVGQQITLRFTARVAAETPDGTVVANQATVEVGGFAPEVTDDPATPAPDDPTRVTVVSQPDFATATKRVENLTGPADTFRPGDRIRWTLVIPNTGTRDAADVVVEDPLPAGLLGAISPGQGGVLAGGTVRWALGPVPAGQSRTLTVEAELAFPLEDGTVVSNQARVQVPGLDDVLTDDPATPDPADPTVFVVTSRPDLSTSTKTWSDDSGAPVQPGDRIVYTLRVTNTGSAAAVDVEVTDPLPAGLVDVEPGDGVLQGTTLRFFAGTSPGLARIEPGGSVTLTYAARVASPIANATRITNQATLQAGSFTFVTDDPTTPAPSDPTSFLVISSFDLGTSTKAVTASPDGFRPGQEVTYTLQVRNSGTDAANRVTVTDPWPAELEFVSAAPGGRFEGNAVRFDAAGTPALASVPVGGVVTLTVVGRLRTPLANGTVVTNQARLAGDGAADGFLTDDPATPLPGDPTRFTVVSEAAVAGFTKEVVDLDGDGFFEPGDTVLYTLRYTAGGDDAGRALVIEDPLPLDALEAIEASEGGVVTGGVLRWDSTTLAALAEVQPGRTVQVSFRARIREGLADGVEVANQAVLRGEGLNEARSDDPASAVPGDATRFAVTARARLESSTKVAIDENGDTLEPGDRLRYLITLRNAGTVTARDIVVEDTLPAELEDVEVLDGGTFTGGVVRWTLAEVPPGGEVVRTFLATVRADVAPGTEIRNQAGIRVGTDPPVLTDDPSTAAQGDATVVVVAAEPSFEGTTLVVEDLDGGFVAAGDAIRWTLVVRNTGAGAARGVTVRLPVDGRLVDSVVAGEGGVVRDGAVVWEGTPSLASLEAGGSLTLTVTARIRPEVTSGTLVSAQAQLNDAAGSTGLSDDPSTPALNDPTVLPVRFPALARFTKEGVDLNDGTLLPGDRIRWFLTLELAEGSPDVAGLVVRDRLPAEVEDVEVLDGGLLDAATGEVVWQLPALVRAGDTVVLRVEGQVVAGVPAGTPIRNQAEVTVPGLENPVRSDDPATPAPQDPTVLVVGGASGEVPVVVTKRVTDLNGGFVEPGDLLRWTLELTHTGPAPLTGLVLRDLLPPLVSLVPGSVRLDDQPLAAGTDALATGVPLPPLVPGRTLRITLETVVADDAPVGSRLSNQALVSDAATGTTTRSDDPTTPEPQDPTTVVVGEAPELSRNVKAGLPLDDNGDGIAQVGERIRWVFTVPNRGAAPAVGLELTDTLPSNVRWVSGSLRLNGAPLTDDADGDAGAFSGNQLRVRIGDLAVGAVAEVSFEGVVTEGTVVRNQGTLRWQGGSLRTDANGDPSDGQQPTVVVLEGGSLPPAGLKEVADANGGRVEPGDLLIYTLRFTGPPGGSATIELRDVPDAGLLLERIAVRPADVQVTEAGIPRSLRLPPLAEGEERVVVMEARVAADAAPGDVLCNRLEGSLLEPPEPVCVTVGGQAGLVRFGGVVFRAGAGAASTKAFRPGTDRPLAGWVVQVVAADAPADALVEATSQPDGTYRMPPLATGAWRLRVFAPGGPTRGGALFLDLPADQLDVPADAADLEVEGWGVVHQSLTGAPVRGVRAELYWAESDPDPLRAGRLVPPERLLDPSQQGQVVPAEGLYRFDPLEAGRYRVVIDAGSSGLGWPSRERPPLADLPRVPAAGLTVVDQADPADVAETERRWYEQVELVEPGATLRNNHLPLDPFQSSVSITKRADRVSAVVGDIVTYTVTISNPGTGNLTWDPVTGRGGAWLVDAIPAGFRYVDGSAQATIRGEQAQEARLRVGARGTQLLEFGALQDGELVPLSIPARSDVVLRYHLVIGSSVEPGTRARNRALLRAQDGGVVLSNTAQADLRIDYDPVFDQGTLIGRVYCDDNGDGRHSRGERGVPGARIYLDNGYYTEVDRQGQYHFLDIDPGLHLVKLDVNTLPPGSTLTTDERRLIHVTRGTPWLIDFGVQCADHRVTAIEVTPGDGALAEAQRLRALRYVELAGDLRTGEATLDGVPVRFVDAALTGAAGTAPPAPSLPPRPSSAAPDAPPPADGAGAAATTPAAGEQGAIPPAPMRVALAPVTLRVGLDGRLVEPLHLALAATEGVDRWVLEVADSRDGLVIWQRAGDGAPPPALVWDGTTGRSSLLLEDATVYEVRLRAFQGEVRFAESAPLAVAVDALRPAWRADASFTDEALDARGQPTEALRTFARTLAAEAARHPGLPVQVRGHADDTGDDAEARGQSLAAARAMARLLEDAGVQRARLQVEGLGASQPLVPTVTDRTRRLNRRIEVRIPDPDPQVVPADVAAWQPPAAEAVANHRTLEVGTEGPFTVALPRPPDQRVALSLRTPDGALVSSLVRLRLDDPAAGVPAGPSAVQLPQVPVRVDLQRGEVTFGGQTQPWPLLGFRLREATDTPLRTLQGGRLDSPFALEARGLPDDLTAWRLEVLVGAGLVLWEASGEGPPGRLRWNGETTDRGPLTAGCYQARLTVRRGTGGLATSPPLDVCVRDGSRQDPTPTAPTPAPTTVHVQGQAAQGTGAVWEARVDAVTGAWLWIDVAGQGGRWLEPFAVPAGFEALLDAPVDLQPQSIALELAGLTALTSTPADPDPATRRRRSADADAPGAPPGSDGLPGFPMPARGAAEAPAGSPTPTPAPPDAQARMQLRGQGGPRPPVAANGVLPGSEPLDAFYARELALALATDEGEEVAAMLAASPAGQLDVQLPPPGFRVQSSRLPVHGTTHPDNRLWVQGVEVDHHDGEFLTVIDLPGGRTTVVIETEDTEGNRGRLEWPVEVAPFRYFVMALGDSAIGTADTELAGAHSHNSLQVGDNGPMLYGQARAWFKGWLSGEEILGGYFDQIEITAFVDTGRRAEYEAFLRETIQPERWYPVFGDASQQVADVNARGKIYVLIEADESSLRVGNLQTGIQGVQLMRYDRNLYGAQVVFEDTLADHWRTEVRAHIADEDRQLTRTFNYLRGTGGSIYYLEQRPVLEGSEQVALIVRDRVSGIELYRQPMTRNTDYTVRYSEGRLVTRQPIPSVVDDAMMLGGYGITRSVLQGHPVFLEVGYDFEGGLGTAGQTSWGVFGRETFRNLLSVGGGSIREARADQRNYELWSVEAGLGATATTRLDVEYARSRSNDLGYGFSEDGGLTFQQFRLGTGRQEEGDALYARGRFELADVIPSERSRILGLDAYYHRQDRGFFSNGTVLDQGEEKVGGLLRWMATHRHAFTVRHDTVTTELDALATGGFGGTAPGLLDDRPSTFSLRRRVTAGQYEYNFEPVNVTLSWMNTFTDDVRVADGFQNDIVGASIGWRIVRGLRIGVDQEIVARGEDPRLIRGAGNPDVTRQEDRFITGVTLAADLGSDIELQVSERFRYSGENATLIGLRARIDEESSIYAQQRLTSFRDNHGTAATTVVGGEQRHGNDVLPGRSYGEYHVDSGMSGERSRAVLGFGQSWRPLRGVSFSAGYERSQTLASQGGDSDSSRDTVSLSAELRRFRNVKASTLLEGRFDRGSLVAPFAQPCLANDVSGNPLYCRDRVTALGDRRQLATLTTLHWKVHRDWTAFGRFDLVTTENQTLDQLEARSVEGTVGGAFRPVMVNWLNVLGRYTWLEQLAPYQLELDSFRHDRSHVVSLSPIFELPWNLQWVEKVAWRGQHLRTEDMPAVTNHLILWTHRLNYHLTRMFDVGAEYRFLRQTLTRDWRHGLLLEFNWILEDHVRLGVGYNFSRFAEDELGDFNRDAQGVFFRVTVQY